MIDITNSYKTDKINEKVKNLVENFDVYTKYFKENNPFSGPSEYFYKKIVTTASNSDYNALFNESFIELLYATLAAWGMHRMGPKDKGPKMNDFKSFELCILNNQKRFLQLKDLKLNEIELNKELMGKIESLYSELHLVMESNSKLVATTKIMHFLLPNLISPMDREYTMAFFEKHLPAIQSIKDTKNIQKELMIFEFCFRQIHSISKKVKCEKFIDEEFSFTIPKVIDNAIMGFVRKNSKN